MGGEDAAAGSETWWGALILAVGVMPYIAEIVYQLYLQAVFVATLSPAKRAELPPHPEEPWKVFLGSLRFQLAFWRYIRRDFPDDPAPVSALKHRMRASLRRELIWALFAAVVLVILLVKGWRPFGW
jgi:hypothetical protein